MWSKKIEKDITVGIIIISIASVSVAVVLSENIEDHHRPESANDGMSSRLHT